MLGTGEWASSASESTMPSATSNSCTVGTYWRQIGSPGSRIKSTIAGDIRNSKFSAACLSRSISCTCSGPNRSARASSEAMLRLRSSSCQVISMRQFLDVDHQVVAGGVVPGDGAGPLVSPRLVKRARRRVIGAGRGLDHEEAAVLRQQPTLDLSDELGSDSFTLPGAIDRDVVQVVRAGRTGDGPPASVANQL